MAMRDNMIGIVNYGAGNIFSLTAALDRIGIGHGMVNETRDFDRYGRIIVPGVGHAGAAVRKLRDAGLAASIALLQKPVLGICVGMQLLTSFSEEGDADLLDIVPMRTLHFAGRIAEKVPHIGWNSISMDKDCPLFRGIADDSHFYFVHSYFIEHGPRYTAAVCRYGTDFSAAIRRGNFFGVQFHPEKSGTAGERLLRNFSEI